MLQSETEGAESKATYQGTPLEMTIPRGRLLFGPTGHFTLQNMRRVKANQKTKQGSLLPVYRA